MTSVAQQAFNTEVFGVPCHRVVDLDRVRLERDLPPLLRLKPVIIDAKVPADRTDLVQFLLDLGFRSVCTQVTLVHDLATLPPATPRAQIHPRAAFDAETIRAHAANFRTDRFARDPMIQSSEHDRLYERWIGNSLSGAMPVAVLDQNFCSFQRRERRVTIDLLSVLDKKQGIGRDLVCAVLGEATRSQSEGVAVVTECGNEVAWRLYLRCGFRPNGFIDCLHFVSR